MLCNVCVKRTELKVISGWHACAPREDFISPWHVNVSICIVLVDIKIILTKQQKFFYRLPLFSLIWSLAYKCPIYAICRNEFPEPFLKNDHLITRSYLSSIKQKTSLYRKDSDTT